MGMYDEVIYSAPCFNCGMVLTDWQTKDGPCCFEKMLPHQVMRFYTTCEKWDSKYNKSGCGQWNEYEVIPPTSLDIRRVVRPD